VRPSTVAVQLVGPDGAVRELGSGVKPPGTYAVPWDAQTADGVPEPEGRWRWHVGATDDLGRKSATDRSFSVNTTLGYVTAPSALRSRRPATISFTLARAARIRVTVESAAGEIYRTVASGPRAAGRIAVRWNGRDGRNRPLSPGSWAIRVAATNEVGVTQFRLPLTIR